MNQKAYSILFCALLASTFVHEIRAKAADSPSFIGHNIVKRNTVPEYCQIICDNASYTNNTVEGPGPDLEIIGNETTGILAVGNFTANVVVLVDFNTNQVAVLNGKTGAAVLINIESKTGIYIKTGCWYVSKTSFRVFLAQLDSLSTLPGTRDIEFNISSVPSAALQLISDVIASMVHDIRAELKDNALLALKIVLTYANVTITLGRGALKGFLTIVGNRTTVLKYDLVEVLNIIQSLGALCGKFPGGLKGLMEAGVNIRVESLFGTSNGLEILIMFILALGTKVDIEKYYGSVFNDPEAFFTLLAQMGGNSNIALAGLFKALAFIFSFTKGNATLEQMIIGLIQFLGSNSSESRVDLEAALTSTFSILLQALQKAGQTKGLSKFISFVQDLINAKLTFEGVAISTIIKILGTAISGGGSKLLQALVSVIIELKSIVAESVALPMCMLILILNINTLLGIKLLRGLGITIEIGGSVSSGKIISSVLKSSLSVIKDLIRGNYFKVLMSMGAIGKIVAAFSAAVTKVTGGKLSLESIINSSATIKARIKALIQVTIGFSFGIKCSSTEIDNIKTLMNHTSSIEVWYSINISSYNSTIG